MTDGSRDSSEEDARLEERFQRLVAELNAPERVAKIEQKLRDDLARAARAWGRVLARSQKFASQRVVWK